MALFPYVIMVALLLRAVTLEGAMNGIIFFIKPQWDKLFEPQVWYAAVTQCFFSLSVCFGGVVMYSSYNSFRHNIYRWVHFLADVQKTKLQVQIISLQWLICTFGPIAEVFKTSIKHLTNFSYDLHPFL